MWHVSKHPELVLFIDHRNLQTELRFICLLLVSIKNEDYNTNVNTRYKLLAPIPNAAIRINKREVQLRREASYLHTRGANCIEVEVGNSENLFITNLSFLCKKFAI
jgi:hypothetical protein